MSDDLSMEMFTPFGKVEENKTRSKSILSASTAYDASVNVSLSIKCALYIYAVRCILNRKQLS